MNYQKPELQQRLAAEYVLGTLQGKARIRFEALMVEHTNLRVLVLAWQRRLAPLAAHVAPQTVPPTVWPNIRQRLGFEPMPTPKTGLTFWQKWLWTGSVFASVFAGMLIWKNLIYQAPVMPSFKDVAVLSSDKAEPVWIVRITDDGQQLKLSSLDLPNVPTDRDLELWAIADSAPESLGVMRVVNGQVELIFSAKQKQRFDQGKVLAISVEPKGGSPTGSPTGAVLFTGKLKI